MKYIKTIAVLMLVVVLPAGSWYFLQHGLEWRREKNIELVPKGNLLTDNQWTDDEKKTLTLLFKDKTSFLSFSQTYSDKELELLDQFKDAYTFQSFNKSTIDIPLHSVYDANYLLVDTSLNVRQKYIGQGEQILSRIIEDIALMLPKQKEKDIRMKNSKAQ